MSDPVPFIDLPADCFPFTIEAYPGDQVDDVDPLFRLTVEGPGALAVPYLSSPDGTPVRVVVRYANGRQERLGDPA